MIFGIFALNILVTIEQFVEANKNIRGNLIFCRSQRIYSCIDSMTPFLGFNTNGDLPGELPGKD